MTGHEGFAGAGEHRHPRNYIAPSLESGYSWLHRVFNELRLHDGPYLRLTLPRQVTIPSTLAIPEVKAREVP